MSVSRAVRLRECPLAELTVLRTRKENWVRVTNQALSQCRFNPFTPKWDQFQISPAASPEILHDTVWTTWVSIAYSDERWLYYRFSLPHWILFFSLGVKVLKDKKDEQKGKKQSIAERASLKKLHLMFTKWRNYPKMTREFFRIHWTPTVFPFWTCLLPLGISRTGPHRLLAGIRTEYEHKDTRLLLITASHDWGVRGILGKVRSLHAVFFVFRSFFFFQVALWNSGPKVFKSSHFGLCRAGLLGGSR